MIEGRSHWVVGAALLFPVPDYPDYQIERRYYDKQQSKQLAPCNHGITSEGSEAATPPAVPPHHITAAAAPDPRPSSHSGRAAPARLLAAARPPSLAAALHAPAPRRPRPLPRAYAMTCSARTVPAPLPPSPQPLALPERRLPSGRGPTPGPCLPDPRGVFEKFPLTRGNGAGGAFCAKKAVFSFSRAGAEHAKKVTMHP